MPLPRGFQFLTCPGCAKRGVSIRFSSAPGYADSYVCKYCDWAVYNSGEDTPDVKGRHDLAALNPTRNVWVSDLGPEAVQRRLNSK